MQLSELLGVQVVDHDGHRLGAVTDVRLAVTGGADDTPDAPRVFGLIVSPRTRSSYLGYERSQVRRPALLAAFLRWRHRGTFLALRADLSEISRDGVRVRKDYRRYSPILRTR